MKTVKSTGVNFGSGDNTIENARVFFLGDTYTIFGVSGMNIKFLVGLI